MRLHLCAFGSAGDVYPLITMAREMNSRAMDCIIYANPVFEDHLRSEGIRFEPIGTIDGFEQALNDPRTWTPKKGLDVAMEAVAATMDEAMERIKANWQKGDVMVGSTLALPVRLLGTIHSLPHATVHLAPVCFRSIEETPILNRMFRNINNWPQWFRRLLYLAIDLNMDRRHGKVVNGYLKQHGKGRARSLFGRWWNSPDLVFAMFPGWFAHPQEDWPLQAVLCGFPAYKHSSDELLSEEVLEFLHGGTKPVVFAPGSSNRQTESFFQTAVEALRLAKMRGIFVVPKGAAVPENLPDSVLCVGYTPFEQLFPEAVTIVHRGGVGTMSQCLLAGVPQIVAPQAYDQFDNAYRVEKQSLGLSIWKLAPKALADALIAIKSNEKIDIMTRRYQVFTAKGVDWDLVETKLKQLSGRIDN